MKNTNGFYKYDLELFYAPTFVYAPNFILDVNEKDNYSYPTEGWYYFESREDALVFFEITEE